MQAPDESPARSHSRRRGLAAAMLVATVAVGFAVATTMTAQAATLFSDNFEDGNANGWTPTGGTWAMASDGSYVYRQSSSGTADARSIYTDGTGSNGSFTFVQAKVKPISLGYSGSAALLAKVKDANTYYYLALRPTSLELGKRVNGTFTVLATTPYTPTTGTWHNLTINTFFGDRVTGSVSGSSGSVTVTSMGAASSEFGTRVGVATRTAAASFDDIRVDDDRIVPSSSATTSRPPVTTTPPVTTPPVTTPPVTTPPPTGNPACKVTYTIATQWPGGFQASVMIQNIGTVPFNSWRVELTFGDGQALMNGFSGQYVQIGNKIIITPLPWNTVIQPGGSVTVGFLATWQTWNNPPTIVCTTT